MRAFAAWLSDAQAPRMGTMPGSGTPRTVTFAFSTYGKPRTSACADRSAILSSTDASIAITQSGGALIMLGMRLGWNSCSCVWASPLATQLHSNTADCLRRRGDHVIAMNLAERSHRARMLIGTRITGNNTSTHLAVQNKTKIDSGEIPL